MYMYCFSPAESRYQNTSVCWLPKGSGGAGGCGGAGKHEISAHTPSAGFGTYAARAGAPAGSPEHSHATRKSFSQP